MSNVNVLYVHVHVLRITCTCIFNTGVSINIVGYMYTSYRCVMLFVCVQKVLVYLRT